MQVFEGHKHGGYSVNEATALDPKALRAFIQDIELLILDIDGTVYDKIVNPTYQSSGSLEEKRRLNRALGWKSPLKTATDRIGRRREELSSELGRRATMTETVLSFGLTLPEWNELRCRGCYEPDVLKASIRINEALQVLEPRLDVVFGTNAPETLQKEVLRRLGISEIFDDNRIFGPERLEIAKHDPGFYTQIAEASSVFAQQCLVVGDTFVTDGLSPALAGMKAIVIDTTEQLVSVLEALTERTKTPCK